MIACTTSLSRRPLAFLLPLTLLMLGGCVGGPAPAPLPAIQCGTGIDAPLVFIEIRYAADGMPSAHPETCEVRRGTVVAWRGPQDASTPFVLHFKGASPVANEPRGSFASRGEGTSQVVERRLDAPPGRYEYGIRANGKELDPAIIIR